MRPPRELPSSEPLCIPDDAQPSIGGHQIVARLGGGRSADVFLAITHGPFGFMRPVVIKQLRQAPAGGIARVPAIAREAIAYARLNHPSIVRLYEFIEHAGRPALVLEYVSGMSLAELVEQPQLRDQGVGDRVALYVMWHVFSALAAAHSARDLTTGEFAAITHRDVSPKNVLLDWEGMVKLTDFGIAKLAGVEGDTADGLLKGTYGYMAPEQVLGDRITIRTDVYCGCLLLRELLLGRRTFSRRDTWGELELLQAMATPILRPVEALRQGVPPAVCEALRIGLAVHADRRDITAAEVRDVLATTFDRDAARTDLVRLLARSRSTRSIPGAELSETTERHAIIPAPPSRERLPVDADLGVEIRDSGITPPTGVASTDRPTTTAVEEPEVSGARREGLRLVVLLAACAVFVVVVVALESGPRPVAARPPEVVEVASAVAEVVASAVAAAPTPEPSSPATAAPSAPAPPPRASDSTPSRFGTIVTRTRSREHRVFVDGRVVGTTGEALTVLCGPRRVRYGSKGRWQEVDVPCGAEVVLEPKW